MSLIEYTLEGKRNKVDVAIQRIKAYAPIEQGTHPLPYYVAYSGGKDSDTIRILCGLAGIRHELWHNHTTVDAPETVYYVRSIPNIHISRPDKTMWELIVQKKLPPLRHMRYCCAYLKERGGEDRFVMTGVRRAESTMRSRRESFETIEGSKNDKIYLNADNTENRKQIEYCITRGKTVLNPIIDWADGDVWEFLNHYGCKSNPLYQCGYSRVGCVGCPMARWKRQIWEFERYPKYRQIYVHAFDRMVARDPDAYSQGGWNSGEDVMRWWTSPQVDVPDPNQLRLYEEMEEEE